MANKKTLNQKIDALTNIVEKDFAAVAAPCAQIGSAPIGGNPIGFSRDHGIAASAIRRGWHLVVIGATLRRALLAPSGASERIMF
jgi:hypothetical protein